MSLEYSTASDAEIQAVLNRKRQYRKAAESIEYRLQEAIAHCEEVGIYFDDLQWYWDKAAEIFNSKTLWKVFGLAKILSENQPCTVRSAMYRGVDLLWEDSDDENYNCCAGLILKMRRTGLIPYSWITDGTRYYDKPSSWSGLANFAEAASKSYRKNLWERQPDYMEFFVEKDAMSGVIRPVTREYDVRLNIIRGQCSETFVWNVVEDWKKISKPIHIYYLGDHDPDGLSIETSLRQRLEKFLGRPVSWIRLSINNNDFQNNNVRGFKIKRPKPNASTKTIRHWESKNSPYLERFGERCIEVDAIPAPEIRDRVRSVIESHIDQREWKFLQRQEAREKIDILEMVKNLRK
jgi:hypothetical protein